MPNLSLIFNNSSHQHQLLEPSRGRYRWLVIDGVRRKLIIMDEQKDKIGRTIFHLPEEYLTLIGLAGVEMPNADYGEAAEYLSTKYGFKNV